jgi:hypothetical protein
MHIHIHGSQRARSASARTIYCDGAHDADFRPGIDLELSHWVPNLTPPRYKADTSTEICLRFVADAQRERGFELALNNHVDIDGTLALFALSQPDLALAHRDLLVQVAEMGDFQGWGEPPAQRLYQALALYFGDPAHRQADPLALCEGALALVRAALQGAALPQAEGGVAALARSLALIESDQIERIELGPRAVHFRVPAHVAAADLASCLAVPRFDADLAAPVLLLPQARARRDAQRLQLISVQTGSGWTHDLLYPGYCWAETPNRWRPPGLVLDAVHETFRLDHPPLQHAAAALNATEQLPGRWAVAESMSVFGGLAGRGFPVVLSFLRDGAAAPSALSPQRVAQALAALQEGLA